MIKQLYKKFNAIFPLTRQGKAGFFDAPDLNPDDVMTSSMIDIQKLDPAKSADIIKNLFNNESFFEKEVSDWAIKYLLGHIEHYKDLINHVRKIYVSGNVYAGSGGKLSGRKYGLIVPLLRLLYPGRMRAQLYVLAKKL